MADPRTFRLSEGLRLAAFELAWHQAPVWMWAAVHELAWRIDRALLRSSPD